MKCLIIIILTRLGQNKILDLVQTKPIENSFLSITKDSFECISLNRKEIFKTVVSCLKSTYGTGYDIPLPIVKSATDYLVDPLFIVNLFFYTRLFS